MSEVVDWFTELHCTGAPAAIEPHGDGEYAEIGVFDIAKPIRLTFRIGLLISRFDTVGEPRGPAQLAVASPSVRLCCGMPAPRVPGSVWSHVCGGTSGVSLSVACET